VRCGLDLVDVVIEPVTGRYIPFHGQKAILVCQSDALGQVLYRQIVSAMVDRGETEQLGRSDVWDGKLVLRVAIAALLSVELSGLVEESIAQRCRVRVDARVALLLIREGKGPRQRCQSPCGGGLVHEGARGNIGFTYTRKTKHGGEQQGAAKICVVGREIAQEQVCIKQP
jgi:hypothetical protein